MVCVVFSQFMICVLWLPFALSVILLPAYLVLSLRAPNFCSFCSLGSLPSPSLSLPPSTLVFSVSRLARHPASSSPSFCSLPRAIVAVERSLRPHLIRPLLSYMLVAVWDRCILDQYSPRSLFE